MSNARLDQAFLEIAAAGTPNARLDQAFLEIAAAGVPNARLDQAFLELTAAGSPNARLDQAFLELIVTVPGAPVIPTIVFPTSAQLVGVGYSVHRRPTFSSRVATAVSGREVLSPFYKTPLYEFELTFDVLLSGAGIGQVPASTLQLLMGLFLQLQGQYGAFLFTDPDFNQVTGGAIGTGDGSTTNFALLRPVGGYSEAVQAPNVVSTVYFGGVAQSGSSWSVANGNQIAFNTPPPNGTIITADFTYYFVCRFLDDVHDYEEFMAQMHTLQSCKFRSIRTS